MLRSIATTDLSLMSTNLDMISKVDLLPIASETAKQKLRRLCQLWKIGGPLYLELILALAEIPTPIETEPTDNYESLPVYDEVDLDTHLHNDKRPIVYHTKPNRAQRRKK